MPKDVVMGNIEDMGFVDIRASSLGYIGEGSQPSVAFSDVQLGTMNTEGFCSIIGMTGQKRGSDIRPFVIISLGMIVLYRKGSMIVRPFVIISMGIAVLRRKGSMNISRTNVQNQERGVDATFMCSNADENDSSSFKSQHMCADFDNSLSNHAGDFVPDVGNSPDVHISSENNRPYKSSTYLCSGRKHARGPVFRPTTFIEDLHILNEDNRPYKSLENGPEVQYRGNSGLGENRAGPPLEYKYLGKYVHSASIVVPFLMLLRYCHFMENIRAYNQMFSMTSLGARVDESINIGRGPYVFKISGQLYHWLGSLCPAEGDPPRFLQLYIYDTENKVDNRMSHFGGDNSKLRRYIVEGLIELLDNHNALVQLFRNAWEKLFNLRVPPFKVRLFNVVGAQKYELPTGDTLGEIVYEPGPGANMDFDIVIEQWIGPPQ
uniref:Helitron helicase-like domain-containing protein n=1 Tax=Tanacetum cinerariifolium TaxID=118510 RepID=A0A699J671_TANCI|nr:helitron helicase-like domain-containing protein [Tanacetum cinerariifolium]